MAGLREGFGIEFQRPAESEGGLYGRTFAKGVFGLSEVFGAPTEGMKLSSAGVKFRMRTGRTTAVGPRESNEDFASDRHALGLLGANPFRTGVRSVELTALTALYTAEIESDMITDAVGVDPNALEGAGSYLDFYKQCVEEDVQWRMGIDLLGGNRTGSLATVNANVAALATQFAARRSVSQATAGSRGALALGQDVVFVFADAVTGARIGDLAHRITSIVLGGAGQHDTVNFTPALAVAVPAGAVICEATNPESYSFGRGFFSLDEIAGDTLHSPTLYGQSRIVHPGLNAKVLRDGAALRRFTPALLNQAFRTLDLQANVKPGEMYAIIMSRGIADDLWTGAASIAAGVDPAPPGGAAPIGDRQNAYAPNVEQVWGTSSFVMRCPWAPGGRLLVIATDYAICNSAVLVPLSSLHKYMAFPPTWIDGPIRGTGHKVDRRAQAIHSWWCSATQVFDNVPAIGRIEDLADLQIAAAQGGAGA